MGAAQTETCDLGLRAPAPAEKTKAHAGRSQAFMSGYHFLRAEPNHACFTRCQGQQASTQSWVSHFLCGLQMVPEMSPLGIGSFLKAETKTEVGPKLRLT